MKNKPSRKTTLNEISRLFAPEADICVIKSNPHLMPGLSFARISGEEFYPNLVSELKDMKKEFLLNNTHPLELSLREYEISTSFEKETFEVSLEISVDLQRHLELVLNSFLLDSLVFDNFVGDSVQKRISDVRFDQVQARNLDYETLVATLSGHFRVSAEILRLGHGERVVGLGGEKQFKLTEIQKLSSRIRHAVDTGRVLEIDRLQVNLEVFKRHPDLRIYIFPIRSHFRNIPGKSDFLAVTSLDCDALSGINIKAIDRCVDDYLYAKTRIGQQECLFWQTEQLTKLVELHDVGSIDHEEEFRKYLRKLSKYVLTSTQGHSFSYLEYDAGQKALSRAVFVSEAVDDVARMECMSIGLNPVPIRNTGENLSAYIFRNWANHKERYIYIPNIRNKRSWNIDGLSKISCERNKQISEGRFDGAKTVSEVALVVQDQDMPIGVVCVESPYLDGLNADLLFLRKVTDNAAVFWNFLFRISDQMWLRRNLQLQDISHSLSKLALSLDEGEAKTELSEISLRLEEGVTFETENENSFEERFNSMLWREAGRSEFLLEDIMSLVRFFNPERHAVPKMIQSAAIQIVRDLLRNRRHTKQPHEISLTTRDEYGGASNILVIRTILEMRLSEDELRDAFRRPIRRTDRDHVGLYMMGVVTRTWGGRLDFDRHPGFKQRNLEICIPFGNLGDQKNARD